MGPCLSKDQNENTKKNKVPLTSQSPLHDSLIDGWANETANTTSDGLIIFFRFLVSLPVLTNLGDVIKIDSVQSISGEKYFL